MKQLLLPTGLKSFSLPLSLSFYICLLSYSSTVLSQTFAAPVEGPFELYDIDYDYGDVDFADLDNDDDYDVIEMGEMGLFYYQPNIGSPSAAMYNVNDVEYSPFNLVSQALTFPGVASADLDGDGDLDILTCSSDDASGIYYNKNIGSAFTPSFQAPVANAFNITKPAGLSGIMVPRFVDIDNDNDYDLFISNVEKLYFYKNTGSATSPNFISPVLNPYGLSFSPREVFPEFADFDGDGDQDLLMGNIYDDVTSSPSRFYYHENIGTATVANFSSPLENPFGLGSVGYYTNLNARDMDADGDLDLMVEVGGGYLFYENLEIAGTDELTSVRLQVYPNPARDIIHLQSSDEIDRIEIYSFTGQHVGSFSNPGQTISIGTLPAGLFILNVFSEDELIGLERIVKD